MRGEQLCFDFSSVPERSAVPAAEPAAADAASGWEPLSTEYAVLWVERNRDSIIAQAYRRFYLARFEVADLLQEAYLAALEAVKVANRRRLPFEACFRTYFFARIQSTTSVVYTVRMDTDEAERVSAHDTVPDETGESLMDREEREGREESLCRRSLDYMTKTQREIWQAILDRPACSRQVALRRGVVRQTVQSSIRGGLDRVREAALGGAFD